MRSWSAFVAAFCCVASAALAVPVSIGGDYDVIVRRNFTVKGAHVHGSTAVGGSLVLEGNMSEFGNKQPTGTGPNVVVNQQIVQGADARVNRDGIVQVGSLSPGQSVNGNHDIVGGGRNFYANHTTVGPTGLDTESAFTDFIALSNALAGLSSTVSLDDFVSGTHPNTRLNLSFDWDNPFEVLNLTGNDLKSFSEINVANPGTSPSALIINVDLSDYTGGAFVQNRNGQDAGADWILWNFYGASSLTIDRQWYGTILAPEMTLTHLSNDLKGAVIVDSFIKENGQVHRHRYQGSIPPPTSVPDGGVTAGMIVAGLGVLTLARRWMR